jgi:hypothetical protein
MTPPGLSWHRSSHPTFTALPREGVLRSALAGNSDFWRCYLQNGKDGIRRSSDTTPPSLPPTTP